MKNKKVKIAYLLTVFIFLFTYIGGLLGYINSYAYDNTYAVEVSSTKPTAKSYSTKSKTTTKPKSGSFSNKSKNNFNSGTYSQTPNTTTIRPDSGSFSSTPNNNNNSGSSSTIKPDSGSFSTSPKNNNSNNNTNNNDYGGSSSSRPIFGGGYYSGYNPFRRVFFGYGISSWIMKLVIIITVIVFIYIIIDYIRSKRD